MESYYKNYNFKQKEIKNYLIGNNDFLFGTILGNKKGWRKEKSNITQYYSFLLYYSHETGRVERFLYNRGSKEGIFPIYLYQSNDSITPAKDEKEDYIFLERIEKIFTKEFLHNLIENSLKGLPLKFLKFDVDNNGKLNKDFFTSFFLELMRDYLIFNQSFDLCNMYLLREVTLPLYNIYDENNRTNFRQFHLGCGKIDEEIFDIFTKAYDHDKKEKLRSMLSYYNSFKFIDYSKNQVILGKQNFKLKLNVPQNFNTTYFQNLLKYYQFNLELVTLHKSELPDSIRELRSFINSRTVIDLNDLDNKIRRFNEHSI